MLLRGPSGLASRALTIVTLALLASASLSLLLPVTDAAHIHPGDRPRISPRQAALIERAGRRFARSGNKQASHSRYATPPPFSTSGQRRSAAPSYSSPATAPRQVQIQAAGPSKQLGWVGHGKHGPLRLPNPFPASLPKYVFDPDNVFEAGLLYPSIAPAPPPTPAARPPVPLPAAAPVLAYEETVSDSTYGAPSSYNVPLIPSSSSYTGASSPDPVPSFSSVRAISDPAPASGYTTLSNSPPSSHSAVSPYSSPDLTSSNFIQSPPSSYVGNSGDSGFTAPVQPVYNEVVEDSYSVSGSSQDVHSVPIQTAESARPVQDPEVFYIFYESDDSARPAAAASQETAHYVATPHNSLFKPPADDSIQTIYVPPENSINVPNTYGVSVASSFGYSQQQPQSQSSFSLPDDVLYREQVLNAKFNKPDKKEKKHVPEPESSSASLPYGTRLGKRKPSIDILAL